MKPQTDMFVKPAYSSEPLCRFGPGGEFVAVWSGGAPAGSRGLRLLAAFVEAAAVVLGLRQSIASQQPSRRATPPLGKHATQEESRSQKEKQIHAIERSRALRVPDPSPAPASKDGRRLPGEPMLFPDVRRDGLRIEHKPKHRIRAYRGAAKKGASVRLSKQSTLFDAQLGSVRIA